MKTTGIPYSHVVVVDTRTDRGWLSGEGIEHLDQPKAIHMAFERYTPDAIKNFCSAFYIRPESTWSRPSEETYTRHGITDAIRATGISTKEAIAILNTVIQKNDTCIVGHNIGFDILVLEHLAYVTDSHMPSLRQIVTFDTMQMGLNVCKLPHPTREGYYRCPSLFELYTFLFGEQSVTQFSGTYGVSQSVYMASRCFFEMVRRGVSLLPTKYPSTTGLRPFEEVAGVFSIVTRKTLKNDRERSFVADQYKRFQQYGKRYIASPAVWKWLSEIANR